MTKRQQTLVEKELKDIKNLNVTSLGYECVTCLQLWFPFRGGPVNKVTQNIRDAIYLNRNAKLVVIAHSFGTYILSKILSLNPDINFEKIILCGSIIPTNYRWDIYARNSKSIVNDVGTRDIYPIIATTVTCGYGASGKKGFQNARVKDRYFDYHHSDFFHPDHIKKFWKPFVTNGDIIESDWDIKKPKMSLLALMFCHPWIGRCMLLILFIIIIFLTVSQ